MNQRYYKWLNRLISEWTDANIITPFQGNHIREYMKTETKARRKKTLKMIAITSLALIGLIVLIYIGNRL